MAAEGFPEAARPVAERRRGHGAGSREGTAVPGPAREAAGQERWAREEGGLGRRAFQQRSASGRQAAVPARRGLARAAAAEERRVADRRALAKAPLK